MATNDEDPKVGELFSVPKIHETLREAVTEAYTRGTGVILFDFDESGHLSAKPLSMEDIRKAANNGNS